MPTLLNGKAIARKIEVDLAERLHRITGASGAPVLATILVGSDPASATYVKMKGAACRRIGLKPRPVFLPEDSSTAELLAVIDGLNADPRVCGILLQHPVPAQIDERACFDRIDIAKDIDGVTSHGFGRMALQQAAFGSATPAGVMTLLRAYAVPVAGKHAVVVGRSPILGKPMAQMLLNADATVTVCHSKTLNLPAFVRQADIIVGAVGKPRFIQGDWIKDGAVVVDAGYHPGGIGDIDLTGSVDRISAYTPVPGGVGPMTIATLMTHTVSAAESATPHRIASNDR